jgi:hypothetical protein
LAAERVRGVLFVDYVRMVRAMKDVDWSKYLELRDMAIVGERIDPDAWYPMATFERLGIGILHEVARGQLDGVRMWGRFQVDAVKKQYPHLLAEGDPRETLMRFDVLAGSFFDPQALRVVAVSDDDATISIDYGMSDVAEETACHQSLGFFERLAELAGAKAVSAAFKSKAWAGDDLTLLKLHWDMPAQTSRPRRGGLRGTG